MSNITSLSPSPYLVLLEDYGVSNYYYYVHPVICFCASLMNVFCTVVLASKELRTSGAFFQYSLVNSSGAILAAFLLAFLFLSKCGGSICSISSAYWSQAYTIYAVYYVAGTFYFGSSFIQISIGVNLFLTIKQKFIRINNVSSYKVCIGIFGNSPKILLYN